MHKITERSDSLDVLRGMALLLVIFGHVLILYVLVPGPLDPSAGQGDGSSGAVFAATQAIYAFHMPLFFFISGVTHRKKGLHAAATGALALVFFAQVTHVFGLCLTYAVNGAALDPMAVLKSLGLLRNFSIGVTWFLVALAVIRLLFAGLIEGNRLSRGIVMALLAISFVVTFRSNITVFQVQTWWAGMIFYAAGQALSGRVIAYFSAKTQPPAAGWLAAAVTAAALILLAAANRGCFATPFALCGSDALQGRFMVRMIIGDYGFVPLFVAAAACGAAFLILLVRRLQGLPPRLHAGFVWLGRRTLPLLVLNGCFLLLANPWIKSLIADGYPGWQPWGLGLAVVAAHLAVLPLISPAVDWVERGTARAATALMARLWRRPAAL